jgi:hypothetical protein
MTDETDQPAATSTGHKADMDPPAGAGDPAAGPADASATTAAADAEPTSSQSATSDQPVEDDPQLELSTDADADKCPGSEPTSPPEESYLGLRIKRETAEALKAPEAEIIYFANAATKAEREAAQRDWKKAAGRTEGPLWRKYAELDELFRDIARELVRKQGNGESKLDRWISAYLAPGKPLTELFARQQTTEAALRTLSGALECRSRRAQDEAKALEKAYGAWKSPAARIDAIIASYAALLPTLRWPAQEGDPYAIYRFWFEVAPKHLALRDEPVRESNAPGVRAISAALRDFPQRRRALRSGPERRDGSLYLSDPEATPLDAQRLELVGLWKDALTRQAKYKVLSEDRPDDAASLARKLDELRREEAAPKKLFEPAA